MSSSSNGCTRTSVLPALVTDSSSYDVARAMIESGGQKEPFYILDLNEAYHCVQQFKKLMPRVQIFYAMKSNGCDMLLKTVAAAGAGFDCASPGEINKIRQFNINPLSIIYAAPIKSPEQMMFARNSGVKHTTFDKMFDLKTIKRYWPDARLLIRIEVDGDSTCKMGCKFGCNFKTEAVDMLEEAASLGLHVVGVAFHVGVLCLSPETYVEGLHRAKALFDHEARAGRKMSIVDIGGGFHGGLTEVSLVINRTIEELFPEDVQVIAEPGLFLSRSAFTLFCSINSVKQVNFKEELFICEGVYGSFRCYDYSQGTVRKLKLSNSSTEEDNDELETTIWGQTCDPVDVVGEGVKFHLPRCKPLEDWLVFNNVGAYTICFATDFSCIPRASIRPIISYKLWNKLKHFKGFQPSDFSLNQDISTPIPSSLPPILPPLDYDENPQIPLLEG